MIHSVAKAIEVLGTFSATKPRLSLAEIARCRALPKSTTHNILATLAAYRLVEKLEDDTYALGTGLIALSQGVRVNVELRDRAAPLLRQLADDTRESVYLTVLDAGLSLYIYAVESPGRLLARSVVGERVPLHCTGVGKAILAALCDEEVERIVGQAGLPRFTAATITSLSELLADLRQTRSRGYSLDAAEHEEGTYCIGCPILDDKARVIGACSVSGPDPEIVASKVASWSALVRQTAQEISRRMGYVPGSVQALAGITPGQKA